MKKLFPWVIALMSAGLLVGCTPSGDDDDDNGTPTPSGSPTGTPTQQCTAPDDLGTISATFDGTVQEQTDQNGAGTGQFVIQALAQLDSDTLPDFAGLELWEGYGAFTGGFATGAVNITGDEADYLTCGACFVVYGDVDVNSGNITQLYMSSAGTITIDTIGTNVGDQVSGSISGMTLRELDLNDGSDVPNGCTTQAGGGSFDFTTAAPTVAP